MAVETVDDFYIEKRESKLLKIGSMLSSLINNGIINLYLSM